MFQTIRDALSFSLSTSSTSKCSDEVDSVTGEDFVLHFGGGEGGEIISQSTVMTDKENCNVSVRAQSIHLTYSCFLFV